MNSEFEVYHYAIREMTGRAQTDLDKEALAKAAKLVDEMRKSQVLNQQVENKCVRQVELLKLFEQSIDQKQKMLESKRMFLNFMVGLKEKEAEVLQAVFNELNQVEDDYCVIEQGILNLKRACEQNSEERENVQRRIDDLNREMAVVEKESAVARAELDMAVQLVEQKVKEIEGLKSRTRDVEVQMEARNAEYQKLQNDLFFEGMRMYEQKEKLSYLEECINGLSGELANVQKAKEKCKAEISTKVAGAKEALERKEGEEQKLRRMSELLSLLATELSA